MGVLCSKQTRHLSSEYPGPKTPRAPSCPDVRGMEPFWHLLPESIGGLWSCGSALTTSRNTPLGSSVTDYNPRDTGSHFLRLRLPAVRSIFPRMSISSSDKAGAGLASERMDAEGVAGRTYRTSTATLVSQVASHVSRIANEPRIFFGFSSVVMTQ